MKLEEVIAIARHFISDVDVKITAEESGEYNRAYLLSASSGEYALRTKMKPINIDPADIAYEVEFMEKLAGAQSIIHIPKTIKTTSGELLFEDAVGYYNMQTRVPGGQHVKKWYQSDLLTTKDMEELFSMLAQLHNVYRTIEMTNKKRSPTVFELFAGYRVLLESALPVGPFQTLLAEQSSFLKEKLRIVEDALRGLGYESHKRYPVHYDMSACNVLWEQGKIVSLIDFDWVQESTLEFDFARCVMETCGSYTEAGSVNNLLNVEKLHVALDAYNTHAVEPFKNIELMEQVIDAGSLFLTFWGIRTFLEVGDKERYFMSFFQAGLDRLKTPIQLA
jgi:Ser/Thr protein kinase RdoA (MazF antagonist)